MNIYLVVEGKRSEPKIYRQWIRYINPEYTIIDYFQDVKENNVYILTGGGYPSYFDRIKAGANDVSKHPLYDMLVIAIDSENMSYEEKRNEIIKETKLDSYKIEYKIIIQHFCLETWGLGNQSIVPRSSTADQIRKYRNIFDVLTSDPELLPPLNEDVNRAQFAEKYLKALLAETSPKLRYSKRNPSALLQEDYFDKIRSRFYDTGHIKSFEDFLKAFE